ncbi:MAG: DUF2063 domain-containing protein [Pseudomonadaceae bacterium]|nr:DUF2063 domain-containing protein [Pseudomonadaceae bacterium]
MRLIEWQNEIENYLLNADSVPNAALRDTLIGGPTLDVDLGLAIYHNAYRARLQEVLRGDFEAVHQWLGDEEFAALAQAYIDAHPPKHFSLRWLGADFADFIDAHLIPEQAQPLSELARLEWAFTLAFDAPDAQALLFEQVAALPAEDWPNLQVRLLPSVQWQTFTFNTLDIWRALKNQGEFPGSVKLEQPSVCLVWRQELVTRYRSLGEAETGALQSMAVQGMNFSGLCAALTELGDNAPVQAVTWLRQWLSDGILQAH